MQFLRQEARSLKEELKIARMVLNLLGYSLIASYAADLVVKTLHSGQVSVGHHVII